MAEPELPLPSQAAVEQALHEAILVRGSLTPRAAYALLADHFGLDGEQRNRLLGKSIEVHWENRVRQARRKLVDAGKLDGTVVGLWQRVDGDDKTRTQSLAPFVRGAAYSRDDIAEKITMPLARRGGSWMTGYDEWQDEVFIFANVGVAGRTGHDYANHWAGKDLVWYAKATARLGQEQIDRIVSNTVPVHVFWRGEERQPFTYAGLGQARSLSSEPPVQVLWSFEDQEPAAQAGVKEVPSEAWRRGPPPIAGLRVVEYGESETEVYLMRLTGPTKAILDLDEGEEVIKIGISTNVPRRLAELNCGFPPGSRLRWSVARTVRYASGAEAFAVEGQLLEELRKSNRWTGGEFGVVPQHEFERILA